MFIKIINPLFGVLLTIAYITLGILFIEFKVKIVQFIYFIILTEYFIFYITLLFVTIRKQRRKNICNKQENEYISYQTSYPEYGTAPEPSAPVIY